MILLRVPRASKAILAFFLIFGSSLSEHVLVNAAPRPLGSTTSSRNPQQVRDDHQQQGHGKRTHQCEQTLRRKAWHVLSDTEKQAYIDAELCLMNKPSRTAIEGAKSRFDDLQVIHQLQGNVVHLTGYFLPFHRLLLRAHETLLRTECNYTGTQPYWDEARDAGRFTAAAIFSDRLGFGGNGLPSGTPGAVTWAIGTSPPHSAGCIADGPFAGYVLNIGPGMQNRPHCITRSLSDSASQGVSQGNVDACMGLPTFAQAWPCFERAPHSGGHRGVGGEMYNPYSSPGDPLFYLHHAWLDKLWWQWQLGNLPRRISDVTGRKSLAQPPGEGEMVGLGDWLYMMGVIPDARIGEVMDLRGRRMCVEYDDLN
ncbi:hypothetical protein DFH27DRAFT_525016 [Peziza echinospora]|nr:hypothetical protein DFH27DRAFT_525016 [Peziza echinospora]